MKMKIIKFAALIAALFLVIGCASSNSIPASSGVNTGPSRTAKKSGGNELDNALREISDYHNKRIAAGSKAVFLNIKSDWPDLSDYILSTLAENAVNDEVFSVVDRQQLDAIRSELNFQWSGEVSDASAQEIGQMLGAQSIVSGTITTIGSVYRIQVRAIAVQTASVQGQFSQNVDGKAPTVAALTKRVVPAGSGASSAGGSATASGGTAGTRTQTGTTAASDTGGQQAQPAQTAATTYKIGDTGPAGGLIFYDKGNNSSGWRYLEAAPADIGTPLLGMAETIDPTDCKERGVGWGKRNTAAIMKEAEKKGGGFGWAAQACVAYTLNGFNDWFLPSRDELHYMYGNLHMQGLGNFRNEKYWSSTTGNGYWHWAENFKDGKQDDEQAPSARLRVRAIRQF
jgi:hypothetical protein